MTQTAQVEIPNRALFKAAEVCELVKVQSYVLRSWESEFPHLGIAKTDGGPRVYRRMDVEQVLRIKHLLLVEGLTLAGARRRLAEEAAPVGAGAPAIDELIGQNARERLTLVKRGLRSILDLLTNGGEEFRLAAPVVPPGPIRRAALAQKSVGPLRVRKPARGKVAPARQGSARASHARRKRPS